MAGTLLAPDGRRLPLARNTLLGSGAMASIRVQAPRVSQLHALCRWKGDAWLLLDLASTNGTRVDGVLVEPGRPARLAPGARVGFGTSSGDWVLEDAAGPGLHAVRLTDGAFLTAPDGVLVLPDGDSEVDVHQGEDGRWLLDRGDEVPVTDGEVLPLEAPWRVHLPDGGQTHVAAWPLAQCVLHLWPAGETGARAVLVTPGARHELGQSAYWGLALALARAPSPRSGLEHEVGWVDNRNLKKELGIKERSVHQYATQVRKFLASCPVLLPGRAIEARRNQRRLVDLRVEIHES